MNLNKVFIIIPAYNVAKRRFRSVLEQLQVMPYQIIVVDDGSVDETAHIAEAYATVVRHAVNRGQGAALMTGMQLALEQGAELIVHFDADGQMLASDIPQMIAPLELDQSLDVVLGSRFLGPNTIPWSKKYFLHKPALWFQRLTSGLQLTDVHNGFRVFRASAARRLEIKQDRMAHASEIISQIKHLGLRYQEVPVTILYYEYGQGFRSGARILSDLFKQAISK